MIHEIHFDPYKARLSAALSVLENEDWRSTKNFDKLKKKLESIVRWKNLGKGFEMMLDYDMMTHSTNQITDLFVSF